MTRFRTIRGSLLLAIGLGGRVFAADSGSLVGWVADTRGTPVPGAVVSLFGKGLGGPGLVTLSDSAGRFFLSSLPPGVYVLRALDRDHHPAPAREVEVRPNEEAAFSVSLSPLLASERVAARTRELEWLLRHKSRSVLESESPQVVPENVAVAPAELATLPWLSELGGSLELAATPASLGVATDSTALDPTPASAGVVRLGGRLADRGRWNVAGLMNDGQGRAWKTAAEFAMAAGSGHEIQSGGGYGSQPVRPGLAGLNDATPDTRGVGALFAQDRWDVGRVTTSVGLTYTFVGYVTDPNHMDPSASLEMRAADGLLLHAAVSRRTVLPSGDPLTLSTLAWSPSMAFAAVDRDLRSERLCRYELGAARSLGSTSLSAFLFHELEEDPLLNAFGGDAHVLRISNAADLKAQGVGVTVSRRFGRAGQASVTYTYGRGSQSGTGVAPILLVEPADFQDISMQFETFVRRSDTRLRAFYRLNTLPTDPDGAINSRFDVQLRQGLPLLDELTRVDWELLISYRNLFYDGSEAGTLDELLVQNPPKRIVGGIAVRF